MHNQPPLKLPKAESLSNPVRIERFRKLSTDELIESLEPEKFGALKTQPDGTVLEGHRRVIILRERGVDVDALPREVWERIG